MGVNSAARRIIHYLTPDPSLGKGIDLAGAFRTLNGLNMAHMLQTLERLKEHRYLPTLIDNFSIAKGAGVYVERLDVAIQAVSLRKKISPKKFDETVLLRIWPNIDEVEGGQASHADILNYLRS